MNWASFAEFTDMGGYGLYVWGSYIMAAAALIWEAFELAHRRRSALAEERERAAYQE
ncbi:Heme exporter protein D [Rubrivivax sp. A210]|uniref:heme exporter protein CcmD n=1 Tax=Rubrivivax sp. A210 TaxID=2772301 RepID=UPI00191AD63B|nr:heme exporter protein CcmD [Rubrivivax sp. A210]CAD5372323.1 Heme exporter protein D [Rubrivivax sp. A210]